MNNSYIYIYHVNVTQTVPDISPLMPMHQDPLLVTSRNLNIIFSLANSTNQSNIFGFGLSNMADFVTDIIIKSPQSGVTLCFQIVSAAVSVSSPSPPQRLLPLTLKLFALHLRYVRQRRYRSGEVHRMTFPWPWPKVTAVAFVKKIACPCRRQLTVMCTSYFTI